MCAVTALPTYDLGPGQGRDELVVNVVIYGVLLALVLALLWIVTLFVRAVREERTSRRAPVRSRSPEPVARRP